MDMYHTSCLIDKSCCDRFHRKMLESLRDSIDGPTTKSRSEALVDPVTYVLAICEIPSNLMRLYVSSYQVR